MAKPLTLLESVLVQILVQVMHSGHCTDSQRQEEALLRVGLTKQQANKALGR